MINKSKGSLFNCPISKNAERNQLITKIKNWIIKKIKDENISIFIIDLRLCDADHNEINFEELTGIQIIDFIKNKINKGIQIIVSTASNKIWNLQNCIKYGVDSFTIKESPNSYAKREETRISLVEIERNLVKAAEKTILVEFYNKIEILKSMEVVNEPDFNQLVFGSRGFLNNIEDLIFSKYNEQDILHSCLIICFKIIENYCNLKSIIDFRDSNQKRVGSGKIIDKYNNLVNIYSTENNQTLSKVEIIRGRYDFMNNKTNNTPVSFKTFEEPKYNQVKYSSKQFLLFLKIISIFKWRENIDQKTIEEIMRYRYIRNNISAHLTGNIRKNTVKLTLKKDIMFFINLFDKIFT